MKTHYTAPNIKVRRIDSSPLLSNSTLQSTDEGGTVDVNYGGPIGTDETFNAKHNIIWDDEEE